MAVATDEQWQALRNALDDPAWAADAAYETARGRRLDQDSIDEALAVWCRERSADEIVGLLWAAGVPVAKVTQPHRQPELSQLAVRGFFEELDHPVAPPARFATLPMTFARGPRQLHRRHAPLLGEHTAELLHEIGLSEVEIEALEREGVIGMRLQPAASRSHAETGVG
jgi:crotonobetainyl-CoA:carnitine CoA-transferase CaiB-like acyl-CoA transferase